MRRYVQETIFGFTEYACPQDPTDKPGYLALEDDDPRMTALLERRDRVEAIQAAQATALAALARSDATLLRCAECGVAIPSAWVAYRAALRIIVSAPLTGPVPVIPERPPYPEGT